MGRSRYYCGNIVCMITASHNDATYNGLKFDFTLL